MSTVRQYGVEERGATICKALYTQNASSFELALL